MKSFWNIALLMILSFLVSNCSNKKKKLEIIFNDKNDWEFVKEIYNQDILEKYAQVYKNSIYRDSARLIIEQKLKQENLIDEQEKYIEFICPNTISLYRKYLDSYPNGRFINQAKKNIDSLKQLGFIDISKIKLSFHESYDKCENLSYKKSISEYFAKVFKSYGIEIINENDSNYSQEPICIMSIKGHPLKGRYYNDNNINSLLYSGCEISLEIKIKIKNTVLFSQTLNHEIPTPVIMRFDAYGSDESRLASNYKSPCDAPYMKAINSILEGEFFPRLIKTFFGIQSLAFYAFTFEVNYEFYYEKKLNSNERENHMKYLTKFRNVSDSISWEYQLYYKKLKSENSLWGFYSAVDDNRRDYENFESGEYNFWYMLYKRQGRKEWDVVDVDYANKTISVNIKDSNINDNVRIYTIDIYNLQGENIYSNETTSLHLQIDFLDKPKGTYIFCLSQGLYKYSQFVPYYAIITVD